MTEPDAIPDSIPDEVPAADAVEQSADVLPDAADPESTIDVGERPPLEANESDWQEQRLAVDDDPEDEFR